MVQLNSATDWNKLQKNTLLKYKKTVMKKLILLSLSMLFFACNTQTISVSTEPVSENNTINMSASDVIDIHNARTSLDYTGTYNGILPTASGNGMDITIVLNDSSFTKEVKYIGKDHKFSSKGKYTWNDQGNTITLIGEDKPNRYFVGENTLTQMDMDGKLITGEMAADYILRKQD
ncbi:copper resistance protein NlpE [Dysgonomonas sp. OttesenSCG-928-M03]|nr:copper resistance protein NlpE [Dysgonomonas sp. OttesenSCG-928-M03]